MFDQSERRKNKGSRKSPYRHSILWGRFRVMAFLDFYISEKALVYCSGSTLRRARENLQKMRVPILWVNENAQKMSHKNLDQALFFRKTTSSKKSIFKKKIEFFCKKSFHLFLLLHFISFSKFY